MQNSWRNSNPDQKIKLALRTVILSVGAVLLTAFGIYAAIAMSDVLFMLLLAVCAWPCLLLLSDALSALVIFVKHLNQGLLPALRIAVNEFSNSAALIILRFLMVFFFSPIFLGTDLSSGKWKWASVITALVTIAAMIAAMTVGILSSPISGLVGMLSGVFLGACCGFALGACVVSPLVGLISFIMRCLPDTSSPSPPPPAATVRMDPSYIVSPQGRGELREPYRRAASSATLNKQIREAGHSTLLLGS